MAKKSRAEIQRAYRERRDADPSRRQQYLQKEHNKYRKDIQCGKRKCVADIQSKRELRKVRKEWKNRQRDHRSRVALLKDTGLNTPPWSPESTEQGAHESRQRMRGRRIRRREKSAAYRRITQLEAELANAERKAQRYKKRFQRLKTNSKPINFAMDTPRTKTRKLLANFHRCKQSVKKTLVFHYALVDQIKNRYRDTSVERQKRTFARLLTGRIIHRYRLQKMSQEQFGFSARRWKVDESPKNIFKETRKERCRAPRCVLKEKVVSFYTRDDVSRATAGKKDTVTQKKSKMQKRLLQDTLSNTYLKFCAEFLECKISYSMFCRLRPFWVLPPASSDRETCLCKVHDNLHLLIDKLVDVNVLQRMSVERLCESVVCMNPTKSCWYGGCGVCVDKQLSLECEHEFDASCSDCTSPLPKLRTFSKHTLVEIDSWKTKMVVLNDEKKSTVVAKERETMTLGDAVNRLHEQLSKARRHVFNIRHQYAKYRELRSKLDNTSCLIHIDFAENYLCQYHKEIQSVHFGGSHQQTTMHTGMLYVGQQSQAAFCTLSNSRVHEPVAIWTYLAPVFEHVRQTYPSVTSVHFFSDGPTTQYRQKKNFFLFCTKLFEYGFLSGTWNFFEASHGKGAADGVGAVLKRTADRLVKQGHDLPTAQEVYSKLCQETNVVLYFVESASVDHELEQFNASHPDLQTVPGTMILHQLFADSCHPGQVLYRDVSCFCSGVTAVCQCYNLQTFQFELPAAAAAVSCISETENSVQSASCDTSEGNREQNSADDEADISELNPIAHDDGHLLGKYCIIRYNNKPYPGKILEINETDVTVECMHCIGTKYDSNRFFWPEKVKDICMYAYEDILTMIPPPERISNHGRSYNHFRVNPSLWHKVQTLLA